MATPEELLIRLGEALRDARVEHNLSQEELGHRTGVHRNYIGGIERGERVPSVKTVLRLAAGLDVSASELFARAEQPAE